MKKQPTAQNAELFVGAFLGSARAKAGIPIEQAAKDTRIRTQRLREIESDDFSGFVHPTYVRLFLLDYATYLGVPLDEIRPMLPDRPGMATGGFDYLNVLATEDNIKTKPELKRPHNRLLVLLSALAVTIIALMIGLYVLLTWRKIESVALSAPLPLAGQVVPTPTPQPTPEPPPPTPEPAPVIEESTGEEMVFAVDAPYPPVLVEPTPPPVPDPAQPWPDVAVSPFATPVPDASPTPSPSPTPKKPRRNAR